MTRLALSMALVAVVSTSAFAQAPELPAATGGTPGDAMLRWGPLSLQPRIRLSNLGLDSNVFNSSAAPTRDVTATLVPSLESSLRVGRTVTTGKTSAEMVYFQKATGQRSFAFSQEGRFDVPFARVRPFATASTINTHQRPNLEIDQRVEQSRVAIGGGVALRVSAQTTLTLSHDRQRLQFDGGAQSAIATLLNRQVTMTSMAMNAALTPLTTLVIRAESQQDRFDQTTVRDSDSHAVLGGFDFKPFALISGVALVGYRWVEAKNPVMPDFGGVVANVNVSYLLRETTLVAVTAGRGVEYSVTSQEPYYISTGGTVTVRQGIGRWDVLGRVGRNALQYQALRLPDEVEPLQDHRDRHVLYGTGAGVRVGAAVRVGVDLTFERRFSPIASRQYDGFRAGGTLTYGY